MTATAHQPETCSATTLHTPPPSRRTLTLVAMDVQTLPEAPVQDGTARVTHISRGHRTGPTPDETAARKARRRLSTVTYARTQSGSYRARYFNEAGFDCYGDDANGNHDDAQATTTLPTPFIH